MKSKLAQELAVARVVHYDLKADNVLLEPLPAARGTRPSPDTDPAADLWAPPSERPPFRVVLADFGESVMYAPGDERLTTHNRGTEFVKSPEMLLVGNAGRRDRHALLAAALARQGVVCVPDRIRGTTSVKSLAGDPGVQRRAGLPGVAHNSSPMLLKFLWPCMTCWQWAVSVG